MRKFHERNLNYPGLLPLCGTIRRDEEHPKPKECPASLLRFAEENPRLLDEEHGGVLGRESALGTTAPCEEIKGGCSDEEGKKKTGDEKGPIADRTELEEILKEFALFVGAVNLQLDADLNRPDGKKSGVPIGQNPDGPDHPLIQAVVSVAQLPKVLQTPARAFLRRVNRAVAKKQIAVIGENELSEKVAEALANAGKPLGAEAMARGLQQAGAIGPYARWSQFTKGLRGKYQAHHILEEKWFTKFEQLGDHSLSPSVILTDAQHKIWNKKLPTFTTKIDTVEDLWAAYKKAYADYPEWLAAIKSYFPNAK